MELGNLMPVSGQWCVIVCEHVYARLLELDIVACVERRWTSQGCIWFSQAEFESAISFQPHQNNQCDAT
jgi:hypothetical protein